MKTKFAMGDRVAIYNADFGGEKYVRRTGEVAEITKEGFLRIQTAPNLFYFGHPKQCRRLKPKKKQVPREFWVSPEFNRPSYYRAYVPAFVSEKPPEKWDGSRELIRVREVLDEK